VGNPWNPSPGIGTGDRAHAIVGACVRISSELTGARTVSTALEPALAILGFASGACRVELVSAGDRALLEPVAWGSGDPPGEPLTVPVVVGGEREAMLRLWPDDWTREERDALHVCAAIFAGAIGMAQRECERRESESWLRSHLDNIPVVTYIEFTDEDNPLGYTEVYVSPQIESLLGYSPQEWVRDEDPSRWGQMIHPEDRVALDELAAETARTGADYVAEYRIKHNVTGEWVWVRDVALLVSGQDEIRPYWHGVMVDITERKRLEQQVEYLAFHDSLTGLPNRKRFEEALHSAMARSRRTDQAIALLFMDLDGFKQVNDSLGHDIGDLLLCGVADRLREATRETDLVARQGGDEFLVLVDDVQTRTGASDGPTKIAAEVALSVAEEVAARIGRAMLDPFDLAGYQVRTRASVGISVYPYDAPDERTLMKHADASMYEAKRRGEGGSSHAGRAS
jgi:diguanylate cyclase (GGDEF)-like protein/PAS domain S-box-containing protein